MEVDAVKPVILLFDWHSQNRSYFGRVLSESENLDVIHVQDRTRLFHYLQNETCDLVVIGMDQQNLNCERLLAEIRRINPRIGIIFYARRGKVREAVRLVRMGASDYLTAPFCDEEVRLAIDQHLKMRRLFIENQGLSQLLQLFEACQQINACEEPESLFRTTLTSLLQATRLKKGALFLNEADGLHKLVSLEALTEIEAHRLLKFAQADSGWKKGGLLLLRSELASNNGLVIPIRSDRQRYGTAVLAIENNWLFDGDNCLHQADVLLKQIGNAFENAEKRIESQRQAHVDSLTGLYNTRFLYKHLDESIARADLNHEPLSFLFIDVDRFKQVNDSSGHLVGSKLIKELSEVLIRNVRDIDRVVRYGGDEFTITLVATGTQDALIASERIRQAVERTIFLQEDQKHIRLTVSIGVATYPDHGRTKEEIIHLADSAMYRSKQASRNSTYIADPTFPAFKQIEGRGDAHCPRMN